MCHRGGFLSFPKVLNDFKVFGVTFDGDLPIDGLITNLFETACSSFSASPLSSTLPFLVKFPYSLSNSRITHTDALPSRIRRSQVDFGYQFAMVHFRFHGQASSMAVDWNDVRSESMGRWIAGRSTWTSLRLPQQIEQSASLHQSSLVRCRGCSFALLLNWFVPAANRSTESPRVSSERATWIRKWTPNPTKSSNSPSSLRTSTRPVECTSPPPLLSRNPLESTVRRRQEWRRRKFDPI